MKKRESGYYWVKYDYFSSTKWEIAFYDSMFNEWHLCGLNMDYSDNDFTEINETKIQEPK